jgi:hypothetical protein
MSAVEQIVDAAKRLTPSQFERLLKKLDALEEKLWQKELEATTRELGEAGITDEDVDRYIMKRRRREGRS